MTDQDPKPFWNSCRVEWLLEAEVTLERLRQILVGAYCAADHDQGYLYVSEGVDFPLWVTLDCDKKLVNFFTHLEFLAGSRDEQVHCANDLNVALVAAQFSVKDHFLWAHTWLPFDGGLHLPQYFHILRRFSASFLQGTRHRSARPLFTTDTATKH